MPFWRVLLESRPGHSVGMGAFTSWEKFQNHAVFFRACAYNPYFGLKSQLLFFLRYTPYLVQNT